MRFGFTFLILVTIILASGISSAQKTESGNNAAQRGIFGSQDEYYQFMGNVKRVAYGPEGNAELQAMVPILNDIALNRPIGWTAGNYQANGTALGMLSNNQVREELEMVDEQFADLQKMRAELQSNAARQLLALNDTAPADLQKRLRAIVENTQKGLDSLLLPHQLERLRQLQLRQQMERQGLVDLLTSDPLKTELEISTDQTRELKKAEKEIEEELEREMQRLREKARKKLLSKLNSKQQKQVEKLLGEPPAKPILSSEKPGASKKGSDKGKSGKK